MTNEQLDQIYNLVHALSDRIANLERETEELRFRVANAECAIDNLRWRSDNEY